MAAIVAWRWLTGDGRQTAHGRGAQSGHGRRPHWRRSASFQVPSLPRRAAYTHTQMAPFQCAITAHKLHGQFRFRLSYHGPGLAAARSCRSRLRGVSRASLSAPPAPPRSSLESIGKQRCFPSYANTHSMLARRPVIVLLVAASLGTCMRAFSTSHLVLAYLSPTLAADGFIALFLY